MEQSNKISKENISNKANIEDETDKNKTTQFNQIDFKQEKATPSSKVSSMLYLIKILEYSFGI